MALGDDEIDIERVMVADRSIRRRGREAPSLVAIRAELARCTGPAADARLARERAALARWTEADGYLEEARAALDLRDQVRETGCLP